MFWLHFIKVRDTICKWTLQLQTGGSELPVATRIQLMAIAQDNLLNSIGIGCSFFKTTYGFLGSVRHDFY